MDGRGGVNAAPRAPPRPAVRRVQINLNLRVILQVAVLLLLLYQVGGTTSDWGAKLVPMN